MEECLLVERAPSLIAHPRPPVSSILESDRPLPYFASMLWHKAELWPPGDVFIPDQSAHHSASAASGSFEQPLVAVLPPGVRCFHTRPFLNERIAI
jgi:hypothetical protein